MAKTSAPVVGLDIGTAFIKVVEMVNKGGRPEITAVGIMPTPTDSVIQGLIIDPPAMGATIRHLLEISGIKEPRKVVSSIAGVNNVTVRIIEVPKMTDRELGESMKYEIDRFVPFAHGQLIERDYRALPIPAATDGNMQVILAVAVQDVITSHMQALKAAGLESIAVEVEPLAISRSLTGLNDGGQPLNETVGVINMGYSNTELSVITGGMLLFPRTISIGGESFTRAIAENLGIRVDAAERLKRQYAQIDLDHIAQAQSSDDAGGAMTDFGFGDFGGIGGPPPSFENIGAPAPPPSMPGLNPMLYGGAPAPGGGFGAPGAPSEDEPKASAGSVFDLEDDGDELSSLFPGQAKPAPAAPAPTPPPAAAPSSSPPVSPIPGFDLGFGAAPAAPPSPFGGTGDAPPPPGPFGAPAPGGPSASEPGGGTGGAFGGGLGGGFDLDAFDIGGGAPPVGSVSDAAPVIEDEELQTIHQVQEIMLPVLGELVTELRRSMEYYRSHNPKLPVTRLFLAGGSARMPNLDKFLENELGIPVTLANPLAAVSPNVPTAPPGWLQEIAPVLSIAIGLGEREMLDLPRDYVPRTLAAVAAP